MHCKNRFGKGFAFSARPFSLPHFCRKSTLTSSLSETVYRWFWQQDASGAGTSTGWDVLYQTLSDYHSERYWMNIR
jgi:hypothetical protein